jgi:phasin family protein
MSQKPRTGAQARAAAVAKVAPKKAVMKAAPAKPAPVAKAEPVEMAKPIMTSPIMFPAEPVAKPIVALAASQPEIVTAAKAIQTVVNPAAAIKPTKPTITQGMKTMMKSTEDFVAFGQANLEAFVKSGQIWSAGVQELTKQFATSAKASFEESVSTFKAISTCKSVKEAMEMQSTFAKAALEKAMAESNKLTDASIKLTEQTLAPITARVTVAVETFGKAA